MLVLQETCLQISFMNNTKSNGPRMEPWGTQDPTGKVFENFPLITTFCSRSLRYAFIKLSIKPSILN